MGYRLGLDVGTNSLGWSVIGLDESGKKPRSIEAAGVRIFSDGRTPKTKSTLKAERGQARSARRRHDRYKQRRRYLLETLIDAGLFPQSEAEKKRLQVLDPLELRARALYEALAPDELGRALFHLNQRRGFKSNRKDAESRSGVVRQSIDALKSELSKAGCETLGQLLWTRRKHRLPTRARRMGTKAADLYQFYPSRELMEDEFDLIWERQRTHHPEIMGDDARDLIRKVIFHQRPLKPQEVGRCTFFESEKRTFRALPGFQRYRMMQEVNNLSWSTPEGQFYLKDVPDARDLVLKELEAPAAKSGNVTFTKIKKIIKGMGLASGNFDFNLESGRRKGLDGNLTSTMFQDDERVGDEWHDWSIDRQNQFVGLILDDRLEDKEVIDQLMVEYELDEQSAENCINAPLPDDTAQLSLKAADVLARIMEERLVGLHDAIPIAAEEHEDFRNPYKRARDGELLSELPYYGEAVRGHIIPGRGDEVNEQNRIGMVPNPTVHIALNQIRRVVNELIKRFGHPESISIELGRNLPAGADGRREIEKQQTENQKRNDGVRDRLKELGQTPSHSNVIRMKLWEELGENPTDRRCPFSGQLIGIAELFSDRFEIEHLIPFSDSLDDSLANKVISSRQANRDKGNRTPYEAFGSSPEDYNWNEIFARSENLLKNKKWRFQEDAREVWNRDHSGFLSRHLNDTRYLGRLTREYLENICPFNRIDVVTGRLTSLFRGYWGLNSILDIESDKKNREDHRHHAVDAIVVGMTTRSILQKVSKAANRAEEMDLERLFEDKTDIDPWPDFRRSAGDAVNKIIVSHKPSRKKQGQLHNETAMGIVSPPDEKGVSVVVVRKPIDTIKTRKDVESIRDIHLKKTLLALLESGGIDSVQSYLDEQGIRRVRRLEKLNVIEISNKHGSSYKAFKGDSNWAMEIFEYPAGTPKSGKWEGIVISRFEANDRNFQPGQTRKPHPAAKLVMRLQNNDCVLLPEVDGNTSKVYRVQRLSKGIIALAEHNEANVDARNREKDIEFKFIYKSPDALRKAGGVKAHVSPSGRVQGASESGYANC